ncbi:anoctamin-1 isoform X1 [Tachysurus ichikawai]
MMKTERYSTVPSKDAHVDIISIKGTEDIDYMQHDIILLNSLTPDESSRCRSGLYFLDGERRVDYVLTYQIKKPGSSRRHSSRLTDNVLTRSLRRARNPEPGVTDHHDDDKRFRREEFETNLREMGLELERDEDTKTPGVGFVKIHAPWHVLCREAEFMKLKMPTKKVYEVKKSGSVMEKINTFIYKVTDPLHPNVEENRIEKMKRLSYPFSREKQHLFDMLDRDLFFDSKTRSSIVFEVLKRTKCTKSKFSMGITSLLGSGAYLAAYPLHDVSLMPKHQIR